MAVLGELALDGKLRSVGGIVAHAASLAERGTFDLLLPESDAPEAARVPGIRAFGVRDLAGAVETVKARRAGLAEPYSGSAPSPCSKKSRPVPDYSEIAGQERAKRALEIAAAGGHNILLEGAPGSGKTLLCRAFPGILPPVSQSEILSLARIRSVAESADGDAFSNERPFRNAHPGASVASLLGG